MKFIPIEIPEKKLGNPRGGKPQEAKVSVYCYAFSLNNKAMIELAKIWGGPEFSIRLFVSECGDYVGIGAAEPKPGLTGVPKSVTSKEAYKRLNFGRLVGRHDVFLKGEGNLLVGKVN